jgi:hypothetical protein
LKACFSYLHIGGPALAWNEKLQRSLDTAYTKGVVLFSSTAPFLQG